MGRLRLKFDPGNPIAQCHSLTKPAHNSPRSHCLCSLEGREEDGSHHLPQIQPCPLGTPTLSHRSEMDAVMQQRGRRVLKVYLEGMDRERRKGCNVAWEFEQISKYFVQHCLCYTDIRFMIFTWQTIQKCKTIFKYNCIFNTNSIQIVYFVFNCIV